MMITTNAPACFAQADSSSARTAANTTAATSQPLVTANEAAEDTGAWFTLDHFVSLTQIVSNLGVVLALVLTLRQLSSTVRLASDSAVQSNAHAINEFYMALATSDDLARIYREGRADPSTLNPTEAAKFFYTCVAWFAHHEQAFGQVQSGLLSKQFFDGWEAALRDDLVDLGFQQFWQAERSYFDQPFRDLIDGIIVGINAAPSSAAPSTPPPPAAPAAP